MAEILHGTPLNSTVKVKTRMKAVLPLPFRHVVRYLDYLPSQNENGRKYAYTMK